MQAMVSTEYGSPDVLHLAEVEKPTPGDHEVLVRIHAASINAADWHFLRGTPFVFRFSAGLLKPKNTILGSDIAGRVEAVGSQVTAFRVGDDVFGDTSGCGLGAFAEYVAVPAAILTRKPASISFEAAAAVPMAGVTALQGLHNRGQVQPGQAVLINGASGGVGTFAVQIAKALGAEVTAVCSPRNVDMMHSLGADHVIDYTQEDFTRSGKRYDLILAANGYHPISAYKRALHPGGTYVMTGGAMPQMFEAMLLGSIMSINGGKNMSHQTAKSDGKELACLGELLETGKVVPVIDRCYPLADLPDALRYLEAGHARGKVVITVA